MKNRFHIATWKIRKSFGKRPNRFASLSERVSFMQRKLDHARLFGGAKLVFLGDSNGENLSYDDLSNFKPVSINISLGGTRFDTWYNFLISKEGKIIYDQIKNKEIIINLGGNHILQNSIGNFEEYFDKVFKLFPNAWYVNVPKIHSKLIEEFTPIKNKSAKIINDEIKYINNILSNRTKKIIDMYSLTAKNDYEPYFFVHEDFVHFSDFFDQNVRIPFIKFVTGL